MEMLRQLRKNKNITLKELGEIIGVAESTVSQYENSKRSPDFETLLKLAEYFGVSVDYLLTGELNKKNTLTTPDGREYVRVRVLGSVPAGVPVEAIEDEVDFEDISGSLLRDGSSYFGLKVKGDSMYPKYLEGDTVIVRQQSWCESGQDCVVYVNGYEATLKTVKNHEDGSMTLQPLNPQYSPRTYTAEEITTLPVAICGVVVELRRTI